MTAEGALIELDSVRPAAADPSPEALAPTLQSLHDAVNRIANQAGRMGQVLDHIRIFSRRDSGPAELFDAAVVMRRAQDSLRSSFLDSAIDLQSSVPDALRSRSCQPQRQPDQRQIAQGLDSPCRPAPGIGSANPDSRFR
jgi:signal transduction histidine kinase